mmetsp:Transcript_59060/g.141056  ORF Transcript_59060/g.141056 Transcript_59060/m.141056 type:complete len:90 (+) Transcript_59060:564-833(+)
MVSSSQQCCTIVHAVRGDMDRWMMHELLEKVRLVWNLGPLPDNSMVWIAGATSVSCARQHCRYTFWFIDGAVLRWHPLYLLPEVELQYS